MFNSFSKELLKRLKSIHKELLSDCGDHKLNDYFNDRQITAINKLETLIAKVYAMENPSCIIEAARKGDLERLTKLLEDKNVTRVMSSEDVDTQDKLGYTALHLVVELHEDTAMAAVLLDAGADPHIYCNAGRTPLEYAIDHELDELEELLREHGATGREDRQ